MWYRGIMLIGISRPKSLIPVVDMATKIGFFEGDRELTASRTAVTVLSQIVGSSRGGGQLNADIFGTDPIPLTIMSTTLFPMRSASETLAESFAFPWTMFRWREMISAATSLDSRRSVSFDGIRTTGDC
jgi:hypothetical protein